MNATISHEQNGQILAALMTGEDTVRRMIESVLRSRPPANIPVGQWDPHEWWNHHVSPRTIAKWHQRNADAVAEGKTSLPTLWHYATLGQLPAIIDNRDRFFHEHLQWDPKRLRRLLWTLEELVPLRNAFVHQTVKPTPKQAIDTVHLLLALVRLIPVQYHEPSDLCDSIATLSKALPRIVTLPQSGDIDASLLEDKLARLATMEREQQRAPELTTQELVPADNATPTDQQMRSQVPQWEIEYQFEKHAEEYLFGRLRQVFASIPEHRREIGIFRRKAFDKAKRARIRELRVQRIAALELCLQDSYLRTSIEAKREDLQADMYEGLIDVNEFFELNEVIGNVSSFTELVTSLIRAQKAVLANQDWVEARPDDDEEDVDANVK